MAETGTLRDVLTTLTAPAADALVQPMERGWLRCFACGHRCKIAPGHDGICRVRFNDNGILKVPHGYVAALAVDPIEKKPFFHALPGSRALSFGMLGCDYRCGYCQNWVTSQAIRDLRAVAPPQAADPGALAQDEPRDGGRRALGKPLHRERVGRKTLPHGAQGRVQRIGRIALHPRHPLPPPGGTGAFRRRFSGASEAVRDDGRGSRIEGLALRQSPQSISGEKR